MEHIAILSKKGKFLDKILSGEKKVESRWYKFKKPPLGVISVGDTIYFKEEGNPVSAKATVKKLVIYKKLNYNKILGILKKYGNLMGVGQEFAHKVKDKKICILIFLNNVQKIEPFNINKKGYGLRSAWITVNSVKKLKK